MRLLLDTHIALWAILDSPRLPAAARDLIADPANDPAVSVASLWEIAIKHALARRGSGAMPVTAAAARAYFQESGFEMLPVAAAHVEEVERLPRLHADPFDRMLVAQALAEPRRLLTHDHDLARYGEIVIAV